MSDCSGKESGCENGTAGSSQNSDKYAYVERNLARIRSEIDASCRAAGFDPERVTLLAAIKSADIGEIQCLRRYGVKYVGENRVQQLAERYGQLEHEGFHLHFIGSLQTNKVKYIIDKVDMVESLDSLPLAREIQRQADRHDRMMDVLIEINIGREPAKGGVLPEDAEAFVRAVCNGGYDRLRLRGFMTMAPRGDETSYRLRFREMRELSETLWKRTPWRDNPMVLSMGMSESYRCAAAEGATQVRVGRALFAHDIARDNGDAVSSATDIQA